VRVALLDGVASGAVGPTVEAGLGDPVELHLAHGAAFTGHGGVGAVVTDVHRPGLPVHGHPERVAEAHGVDLGSGVRGPGGEHVALGDGVGPVLVDLDPQQLAPQVV